MRDLLLATLLGTVVAACARPAAVEQPVPTPSVRAPESAAAPQDVDQLIEALRHLPGEFRFIDPEQTGYYFTGSEALFRRIGELDSIAVPKLIECFGHTEPAAATLDGRPVPIAVMCFQAFLRTEWFQARRRTRTLPLGPQGIGAVRLRSTPEELARTRHWWRTYIAAGAPLGRP
jgi:hypothetical protein